MDGSEKRRFGFEVKTVFLDRDGVINRKMPEGEYVRSAAELELLPGAGSAIARLNRAGTRVLVVSNQRGIALGRCSAKDVGMVHEALETMLGADGAHIDRFYMCPHDHRQCNCRKPMTGMFDQARTDFPEIQAQSSVMVGDSLSDVEFGRNAGLATIFVIGPRETRRAGAIEASALADATAGSLEEAVSLFLGTE